MAIYQGNTEVKALHIGGHDIRFAFMGNHRVFGKLVEGEDFVRAQWLKTEGYAYINTGVKGNQDSRINVIAKQHTQSTTKTITLYGSISNNSAYYDRAITFNASTTNELKNTRFGNRVLNVQLDLDSVYDIYQDRDTLVINGEIKSSTSATNEFETTNYICLYAHKINPTADYVDRELSIKKFSIDGVINLIPCRLLRPIPATLDGNGIARVSGDCGMYNSVNGLFYGNVGSGTFTVSDN